LTDAANRLDPAPGEKWGSPGEVSGQYEGSNEFDAWNDPVMQQPGYKNDEGDWYTVNHGEFVTVQPRKSRK
jgi:hypothetical protein